MADEHGLTALDCLILSSNWTLTLARNVAANGVAKNCTQHRPDSFTAFIIANSVTNCTPDNCTHDNRRAGALPSRAVYQHPLLYTALLRSLDLS